MHSAQDNGCFGYGSLVAEVGKSTDKQKPFKCRLRGWRREWKHCLSDYCADGISRSAVCALTAVEDPNCCIHGAMEFLNAEQERKRDEREQGYVHASLAASDMTCDGDISRAGSLFLYRSNDACYREGSRDFPIWYSYLYTVLLAFEQEYQRQGVKDFIATTDGWQTPILDDREKPIYPRAHVLSQAESALVDDLVNLIPSIAHIGKLNFFSR